MTLEEILRGHLPKIKALQLATSVGDEPWICNLHFYSDEKFNLYWVSTRERLHSKQIAKNPKVAASVLLHLNTAEEDYVIGATFSGKAELLGEIVDPEIRDGYQQKQATSDGFLNAVADGSNPHKWYRLTPSKIVLFDTKHFPDDSRQEVELL